MRNVQGDIIKIVDVNGDTQVQYNYDAWGYIQSVTGNLASTLGQANPYRYRGYRYDNETGLYYLQSRYYNPVWGRFINADSFGGKTGELLSHNLFIYCQNNPIMYLDETGHFLTAALAVVYVVALASVAVLTVAFELTQTLNRTHSEAPSESDIAKITAVGLLVDTMAKVVKPPKKSVIYRSATGTLKSLTPRPVDINGLSFSLIPPQGKWVATTMEAVNATGVLIAVSDHDNHVIIMPVEPGTMQNWIDSRENADTSPHLYTIILRSLCWGGVN